jgi:pimeloyl-ACP methyl ester carboxylesterase
VTGLTVDPEADHTRFLRMGDLRLRVLHTNPGEGRPLLLINGIGAPIEMWQPFVEQLDDRELIRIDLPGCGLSSAPRRPLRIRELASVLTRVMDALDVRRPDVLGYSFGGVVAQELAHRFPNRVDKLVLCSTVAGTPGAVPHPLVTAMMLNPLRYYDRRAAEIMIPFIAGGRTARDRKRLRADVARRQSHPPSFLGYAYQLVAVSTFSSWPWLHRLPHRTLVLHGRGDPVSPPLNARMIAATMRNARLHIIPDGGHLVLLDDPTQAAPPILEFLDEDARPRSPARP